jgi:hypothetical protein
MEINHPQNLINRCLIGRLLKAVQHLPANPDADCVELWKMGLGCEIVSEFPFISHAH